MASDRYILSIDQGTTSTRAILFDGAAQALASASEPLEQIYPQPGRVEHDPEAIWTAVCGVARRVLETVDAARVASVGITNQRETTVVWERATGRPVSNAIVWQDRRTAPLCDELRREGLEAHVAAATGLVIDPYFSATKLAWLLDERPELRARAAAGELCFGTVDSWLVFKLTDGAVHATDATNACRTMLYDIGAGAWDRRLLERLNIPAGMLPEVRDCQGDFGTCAPAHLGAALPILGVAGDQQAACVGHACISPGMTKATFGTGCFVLANTGGRRVTSHNRMLATIAYRLDGTPTYALEGAIFMAGATLQWLRDGLGLMSQTGESEAMARAADPHAGVYLVPAFQGLGAPYWDPDARGAVLGLTRASTANEVVRAGLESVAFQTRDLLEAMTRDLAGAGLDLSDTLRVDGGMTANRWFLQFLADTIGLPVEVAETAETTALGAALHAGLAAGVFPSMQELAARRRAADQLEPAMAEGERAARYDGWRDAVARVRSGDRA